MPTFQSCGLIREPAVLVFCRSSLFKSVLHYRSYTKGFFFLKCPARQRVWQVWDPRLTVDVRCLHRDEDQPWFLFNSPPLAVLSGCKIGSWRTISIYHIENNCLAALITVTLFCPTDLSTYELPSLGSFLKKWLQKTNPQVLILYLPAIAHGQRHKRLSYNSRP